MEIEATWADVVENLDETAGLARFAGPGGWNDADMLEVTRHRCCEQNSLISAVLGQAGSSFKFDACLCS